MCLPPFQPRDDPSTSRVASRDVKLLLLRLLFEQFQVIFQILKLL